MSQPADTRERIIEVAKDRLLAGGLTALSMRKVAQEVGITATAIYRHFESKECLVVAVAEEGFRRFAQYLWRALDAATPAERLRRAGLQYARFGIEQERYYRVMFLTPCDELGFAEVRDRTADGVAPTFQFLIDRVRECMDAGHLTADDPQAVSVTIWSHVHGLVSLYLLGHLAAGCESDEQFLGLFEQSLDRLLVGLAGRE